ncbi:hypothetical protein COV19_02980 [Candidatus Woesearchaeota archaeon CG10_big_fil_rev_8_21_14_0_10_44_13]|nr:MAG: hypothetical protein COV19_02980 [Candidatus Woesearchaeota archaeon CG10_big_fil_rev_8_21_14_0_10_44_13]
MYKIYLKPNGFCCVYVEDGNVVGFLKNPGDTNYILKTKETKAVAAFFSKNSRLYSSSTILKKDVKVFPPASAANYYNSDEAQAVINNPDKVGADEVQNMLGLDISPEQKTKLQNILIVKYLDDKNYGALAVIVPSLPEDEQRFYQEFIDLKKAEQAKTLTPGQKSRLAELSSKLPKIAPAQPAAETKKIPEYNSISAYVKVEGEDGKVGGVTHSNVIVDDAGNTITLFQSNDGKWYYKTKDSKGDFQPCDEKTCGKDPNTLVANTITAQCTKEGKLDEECQAKFAGAAKSHAAFMNFMMEQQEFTFQEGIQLGSNLWALGVKFKLWSEADNPMSQLNEFFTNSKVGLWLSGNWEKSICWETTDFNNAGDGVAFVPGTENVGAWVAGEYVLYRHPSLSNPSQTINEYIYRITSSVTPSGLTMHSGSANCIDQIQFQYSLDGHAIDMDMDGNTNDDMVRLLCDSAPYSLTGQNTLVRYSDTLYGLVCINFQPMFLKPAFFSSLDAGKLCAPIVPSGYDYGTGCQWCPGIFTESIALNSAGLGYGNTYGTYVSPGENRPGISNPTSAPS